VAERVSEADLKSALCSLMREQLRGFVVFRHEDRRTSGVPDISVTGFGRTMWIEVKYANPYLGDIALQRERMKQLSAAGSAYYVIYHQIGSLSRTLIVEPRQLDEWKENSTRFAVGINHRLVVDFIREMHTP
jgi:hypothetical protein